MISMDNFNIEEVINDKFIITYQTPNDLTNKIISYLFSISEIVDESKLHIGKLFDKFVIVCNYEIKAKIESIINDHIEYDITNKYKLEFHRKQSINNPENVFWEIETSKDSEFLPFDLRIRYIGNQPRFEYNENDPLIHIYKIIIDKIENLNEEDLFDLIIEF